MSKLRHFFHPQNIFTRTLLGFTLIVSIFFATRGAFAAWQDPPFGCNPTNPGSDACKTSAPLNVSSTSQIKIGSLVIQGDLTTEKMLQAATGLAVSGLGSNVTLPDASIEGREITDASVTEADLQKTTGTDNTEAGIDDNEIDDVVVLYKKDYNPSQEVNTAFGVVYQGMKALFASRTGVAAELWGTLSIHGDTESNGKITSTGNIEALSGAWFKGDGFELQNAGSVVNEPANPTNAANRNPGAVANIKNIHTASFFGDLDGTIPLGGATRATVYLDDYGIAKHNTNQRLIPVSLEAVQCLDCTTSNQDGQVWKPLDKIGSYELRYERCGPNNLYYNRIIIQNGDTQAGKFAIKLTYYIEEYPGQTPPAQWQCGFTASEF